MSTTPDLKVSINLWTIQHTEYCSILVLQTINEFVNSLRVEHQEGVMDDTLRVIEFGRCRVESRQGPFQLHSDLKLKLQTETQSGHVRTLTFESNHQLADSNEAVMLNSRSKSNPALSSSSDWKENRHLKSANGRWSYLSQVAWSSTVAGATLARSWVNAGGDWGWWRDLWVQMSVVKRVLFLPTVFYLCDIWGRHI